MWELPWQRQEPWQQRRLQSPACRLPQIAWLAMAAFVGAAMAATGVAAAADAHHLVQSRPLGPECSAACSIRSTCIAGRGNSGFRLNERGLVMQRIKLALVAIMLCGTLAACDSKQATPAPTPTPAPMPAPAPAPVEPTPAPAPAPMEPIAAPDAPATDPVPPDGTEEADDTPHSGGDKVNPNS